MRISDWSSDVCSSDLGDGGSGIAQLRWEQRRKPCAQGTIDKTHGKERKRQDQENRGYRTAAHVGTEDEPHQDCSDTAPDQYLAWAWVVKPPRSEERSVGKECDRMCCTRGSPQH